MYQSPYYHSIKQQQFILSHSFEFYFKMFYIIQFAICYTIYWERTDWANIPYYAMSGVVNFVIMLWYALMDGLNMPMRVKIGIGIMVSAWFLWWSYYLTFSYPTSYPVNIQFFDYYSWRFDLRQMTASSCRIVTVFIVKQTVCSLWSPSKATLIKQSAKIVWAGR